jgi:transglutaminase-like putative cysteine protease
MRRERRDGLKINDKVIITEDRKQESVLLSQIFQAAVILIGCFAFRSSFLEVIPLTDSILDIILLELLVIAWIFTLSLWRKYDKIKLLIGCLGYLAFLAWQLRALKNGFYHLENIMLKRIADYYGYLSTQFLVDYSTVDMDSKLLMVMILIPVITVLIIAVVRNRLVIWASLLLLLPVAATFLIGIVPSPANLIAYVITALYLGCSGHAGHYAMERKQRTLLHRINSKAAIWLGIMAILLFFLMKLFLPEERYEGITEINRTKARIQSTLFDFSWEDFVSIVTSFDMTMDGAAGGINGGKLGGVDRVEFDNSEQLEISTFYAGIKDGVYLKGYVGSVYTGHRWIGHSTDSDKLYEKLSSNWFFDPFLLVNDEQRLIGALTKAAYPSRKEENKLLTTDYYIGKMTINYRAANRKYLYVPYYPEYYSIKDVKFMQDLYSTFENSKRRYSVQYYYRNSSAAAAAADHLALENSGSSGYQPSQLTVSTNSAPKDYEESYRQFVYQVYTQLPEEGVEQLIDDFAPLRMDKEYDSVFEKITLVRDYLKDNVDYSLEPGKTPWNKDFVEYFLYENKKGYCAHFASAATLMLRAMGVPARYVEGYAISAKDVTNNMVTSDQGDNEVNNEAENSADVPAVTFSNGIEASFTPGKDIILIADNEEITVSVKDYSAHSWVEVYMDGCGWIPIDFTPGSDMGISAASSIGKQANDGNEVTPTPKSATPTPRQENNIQKEEDESNNTAKEGSNKNSMDVKWIILIVIIIWLIGTVFGFIAVRLISRILRKRTKDLNRKAILLYEQIEGLLKAVRANGSDKNILLEDNIAYVKEHCPYLDRDEFEIVMEIVRRARFGKETITMEELLQVNDFYNTLKETIWPNLSLFKKMYLKLTLF